MKYIYYLALIIGTTYLVGWCGWSKWSYVFMLFLIVITAETEKVKIKYIKK